MHELDNYAKARNTRHLASCTHPSRYSSLLNMSSSIASLHNTLIFPTSSSDTSKISSSDTSSISSSAAPPTSVALTGVREERSFSLGRACRMQELVNAAREIRLRHGEEKREATPF